MTDLASVPELYRGASAVLQGRKVLVIDDDARNVFALTCLLEDHGLTVVSAERAMEGIEQLKQHPDIELVLVDIMMPDIDGYDAMRIIRGLDGYAGLPMFAVTAKAMKGDREKCIAAGASEYLSKPVDVDKLLQLTRRWLAR